MGRRQIGMEKYIKIVKLAVTEPMNWSQPVVGKIL